MEHRLRLLACILLLPCLLHCSGGSSGGGNSGVGTLRVEATDAILDHSIVEEARVDVSTIRVHSSSSANSGFRTIYDGAPIEIDLLDLRNGITTLLVEAKLPAGRYRQVRLVLSGGYLELTNGAVYTTDDGSLEWTSQSTSGLKVFIDPEVVVRDGVSSTLLLDINLTKTFKAVPASDPLNATKYHLSPVVRAVNLSDTGEIRGLVTRDDGLGTLLPVDGATVYILPPGELDLSNSIASTVTMSDGTYAFIGLPEGAYDVVAEEGGDQARVNGPVVSVGSFTVVDLTLP